VRQLDHYAGLTAECRIETVDDSSAGAAVKPPAALETG